MLFLFLQPFLGHIGDFRLSEIYINNHHKDENWGLSIIYTRGLSRHGQIKGARSSQIIHQIYNLYIVNMICIAQIKLFSEEESKYCKLKFKYIPIFLYTKLFFKKRFIYSNNDQEHRYPVLRDTSESPSSVNLLIYKLESEF